MENIKQLLYTDGSLTQALCLARGHPISVDILREIARPCHPQEASRLNDILLWQREVILRADQPLILARTRVGLSRVTACVEAIQHLGNRPLGEWLFRQPNLKKLSFDVDENKKQRDTVYQVEGTYIWVQEIFI
jgi:chorismate--pyruvate lyase